MRLVETSGGSIEFHGQDITRLSHRTMRPIRAGIQMVFQDPYESLDPASDGLRPGGRAARHPRPGDATRASGGAWCSRRCRTRGAASRRRDRAPPSASSVGRPAPACCDRGRHGARARRDRGRRAGLDARRVAARRHPAPDAGPARATRQVSYLFITHDLSLAWVVADRIAVVYLGRIVEIGPSAEVIADPEAPVHEGARVGDPRARGRSRRGSDRPGR